jgi:outer membrane autotransporter protein
MVGAPYLQNNMASGGSGQYTYSIVAGALPPGTTLSATTGVVSGTPTVPGTYSYTIRAADTQNAALTAQGNAVTVVVTAALQLGSSNPGSTMPVGRTWSQTNTASGGTAPVTFALASGALPPGLTLDPVTGTVSGVPTTAGNYTYAIKVTDAAGVVVIGSPMTFSVLAAPSIALTPTALTGTSVGVPYTQALSASGGTAPYTYALSSGSLPPGLTLNPSTGVISGTPTQVGEYAFVVQVRDSQGNSGQVSLTLNVRATVVTIVTPTTLIARPGIPVNEQIIATGGTAPYTFTLASGALPPGITLTSDGRLSGVATRPGNYDFALIVTDSNSDGSGANRAKLAFTMSISSRPDPTADPEVRTFVRQQIDASLRLANTQMANVRTRLQALHSADSPKCSPSAGRATQATATSGDPAVSAINVPTDACIDDGPDTIWSTGSLEIGSSGAAAGSNGFGFHTSGLTMGWDRAVASNLRVGVGVGLASEKANVSSSGTSTEAKGVSAMGYLSYRAKSEVFADALLGYGRLRMDSSRHVQSAADNIASSRNGSEVFASLAAGYRYSNTAWTLVPYARADAVRAQLDGFTETNGGSDALQFGSQTARSLRAAFGIEASTRRNTAWGLFTPRMRLEWQREFDRAGAGSLNYADDPNGPSYRIDLGRTDLNILSLGLGADLQLRNQWVLGIGYESIHSSTSNSRRFTLRIRTSAL